MLNEVQQKNNMTAVKNFDLPLNADDDEDDDGRDSDDQDQTRAEILYNDAQERLGALRN